jgi:hypothetical protein
MHLPSPLRTVRTLESLALTLLPHGGQGAARRNAWAAMAADSSRARDRHEAQLAMSRAVRRGEQSGLRTS